jgi:hypothetical protein
MAARASRLAKSETVEEYQLRHGHGGSSSRARGGYSVINESGPYRADGEHSYFRDLFTGRFATTRPRSTG